MKYICSRDARHRCGMTLAELIIAMTIAIAAMTGIAKLMYMATRQYQIVACRNVVNEEAANIMEDLMSRPWKAIASGSVPKIELSRACRGAVSDAEVQVEIGPEDDQKDARRITVRIFWQKNGVQKATPVQLVAWRYPSE